MGCNNKLIEIQPRSQFRTATTSHTAKRSSRIKITNQFVFAKLLNVVTSSRDKSRSLHTPCAANDNIFTVRMEEEQRKKTTHITPTKFAL